MNDELFKFDETKAVSQYAKTNPGGAYERIIRDAFFSHYTPGATKFEFSRDDINGNAVGASPKNIGDILYTFRYRKPLPDDLTDCAPPGYTWIIEGKGDAKYQFRATKNAWFEPNRAIVPIVLLDRTPEDVMEHSIVRDEQSILASIGYNRLLDFFMWGRFERKQSHWRTNVIGVGQIEIDDVYVGNNGLDGAPAVVTVQAKRDKDMIAAVQISQDIQACNSHEDGRICRPTAVHYDTSTQRLAMMEFAADAIGDIILINERHYILKRTFRPF